MQLTKATYVVMFRSLAVIVGDREVGGYFPESLKLATVPETVPKCQLSMRVLRLLS